MSDGNGTGDDASRSPRTRVRDAGRRVGRAVFGDRVGLLVWLSLVLALGLCWRVGFFITDTYTVANTLTNLADGHLAIRHVDYSLTMGTQPGLHRYEGVLYGRNYGQAALAVPFVWLLEGLGTVVDPRLLLAAGWSGLAMVAGWQVGHVTEDRRRWTHLGTAVGAIAFGIAMATATPLPYEALALVALQLSTLLAAATAGLVAYRLVGLFHGRRTAVAAGIGTTLATPIAFWATIPKRHVLVAALLLAAVYCFALGRTRSDYRLRALAYGFAGFIAWIHAFEGFFVVVALGTVDLLTAERTGRRELATIGLVLALGLAPTFATNVAITGNPLKAPRLLPGVGVGGVELAPGGDLIAERPGGGIRTGGGGDFFDGGPSGEGGGTGEGSSGEVTDGTGGPGDGGTGPLGLLVGAVLAVLWFLWGLVERLLSLLPTPPESLVVVASFVVSTVLDGLGVLVQPERLWHVFVRSGHVPGVRYVVNANEVIELSMVESMPLVGVLVAALPVAVRRMRAAGRRLLQRPSRWSAARQTDLLVAVVAVVFTVIYLSRLPIHSQLTVRYLLPVYPLAAYGVVRFDVVSTALDDRSRLVAWTYGLAVAVAVVGGLAVTAALGLALGEAIQLHALVHLAAAAIVGVPAVARTTGLGGERAVDVLAGALGVAAGLVTGYVVLASVAWFQYGPSAFDVVRVLVDGIPVA